MTPLVTGRNAVPRYHSVGIGAGPANTSLAALFEAVAPHRIALFERNPGPRWHSNLLHAGVRMQTGWIKDLVSLVDPRHRLSFLNYLVSTGRVYAFLSAQYETIPRTEYVRYLTWASEQLEHVRYGAGIDRIAFDDGFSVYANGELLACSDHLILGVGTRAKRPAAFKGVEGDVVVVAEHLARRAEEIATDPGARIAVVGGGQTGAECVLELLRIGIRDIWWFGRRPWFATLEDSPTANDFYRPAYARFFPQLPSRARRLFVQQQILTSDGISSDTLRTIYQRNYEEMLETGRFPVTMLPGREIVGATPDRDGLTLSCAGAAGNETHLARYAVLATGHEPAPLPFDEGLRELIEFDERGAPIIEADFSVRWRGTGGHKLFVQNGGTFTHGLADTNLSLLAMRSALVINSLFDREVFSVRDDCVSTDWGARAEPVSCRSAVRSRHPGARLGREAVHG